MKRVALPGSLALAGCSAAPAQNILGSYFPSWLICLVAGAVVAAVSRQLLVLAGLDRHLLVPALTYLAMAVAATLAIWLVWFGQ